MSVVLTGPGVGARTSVAAELWGTDGTVTAVARSGNTIYVGGSFSHVGPCTGSGIPLDRRTGAGESPYAKVIGSILAAVSDGRGGWYIGGTFDRVGGQVRNNLAHILANGDVSPWAPEPDKYVDVLVLRGGVVYAGGGFSTIGGQDRALLAALDAETGRATEWNAHAQGRLVASIAIHGSTMFVGGGFTRMGGEPCSNLAALDLDTGAQTGWRPAILTGMHGGVPVCAIAVNEANVYVGGQFAWVDGARRNGLAAIDRRTGALKAWDLAPVRPDFPWYQPPMVSALTIKGSTLYAAGCFREIGAQVRNGVAAIDTRTGDLLPWAPSPAGGSPYTYLEAIAVVGDVAYLSGYFTSIGGQARGWLGAVDARTGAVLPWNPRPNSLVLALAASSETIYAGGYFTMLGAWQSRYCLAALDATTGEAKAWDAHLLQGEAQVVTILPYGSTVFVGGDFAIAGNQPRGYLAALDSATALPTSWSSQPNGPVWALALSESVLYAGGLFTQVDGQDRHRAAAMRLSDGAVTIWDPNADDAVASLALGPAGVYAGGLFGQIGGQTRSHIAALDPATGAATPWYPAVHSWGWVNTLAVSGATVYIGGNFISVGGEPRSNMAAVDAVTDSVLPWRADSDGEVEAVAATRGMLFAGGFFRNIAGTSRSGLAALDSVTGSVMDWDPLSDSNIWAMAPYGGTLYVGGDFASVWNEPQVNIAGIPMPAFSFVSVAAHASGTAPQFSVSIEPNPSRTNTVVKVVSPTPGQVKLAIYDLLGRKIATVLNQEVLAAGPREIHVRTAEWPSGTYFCRVEGPSSVVTRKLVVLK